ncbi:CASP-like protein 4C1 [Canna indica]|uniref:CASP-like protein n=1 Tax=Canna indica TaxID=4628 RepID=A0AAQ3KSB4_9LILI|nr:CASP-like protein 4C1 [Canna indica]
MPSPLPNGDAAPRPPLPSATSSPPLNLLILPLRLITFGFSLAAAVSTATNHSPSWLRFHSFRFVFAANAIVAAYSVFEACASAYEIAKGGATLFPEPMQLLFDFAHDQTFAYMAVAAAAAGAADARRLSAAGECSGFCVRADVSVALGFGAFFFLALASLVSGFRLARYVTGGSRRHT